MTEDEIRVATAIYAALNEGRIPSADYFARVGTGGEQYRAAAVAAQKTIDAIRSERTACVAAAAPKVEGPPIKKTYRENYHYDSQGYCDNPGRGY